MIYYGIIANGCLLNWFTDGTEAESYRNNYNMEALFNNKHGNSEYYIHYCHITKTIPGIAKDTGRTIKDIEKLIKEYK